MYKNYGVPEIPLFLRNTKQKVCEMKNNYLKLSEHGPVVMSLKKQLIKYYKEHVE